MYKPSNRLTRGSAINLLRADLHESSPLSKRQSGHVVIIVVIVLVLSGLIGAGVLFWSRQKNNKSDTDNSQEVKTEVVAKTQEKTKDVVEEIIEVDLLLQRSGDESLLPLGTPETFIEYIKTKLNDFDCDFEENANAGYTISKISPRFAKGSVGCIGGAGMVWYLTTAGWEELGYQSMIPCSTLIELAIPSDFMADCYDDNSPDQETIANPNGPL